MKQQIDKSQIEAGARWHLQGATSMSLDALFFGLGGYFAFISLTDAVGESPLLRGLANIVFDAAMVLMVAALARIGYATFLYANVKKE